ncbi:MAG: peptidoglycan-associated lipoprotein Pal [Syntrophales bacterium]|nr:peptidoglycan-associated lipoprotein Pal [Syntrophales bacterium]
MKRNWLTLAALATFSLFVFLTLSGCAMFKETAVTETPVPAEDSEKRVLTEEEKTRLLREKLISEAQVFEATHIYFDFDKYNLKPEARAMLDKMGSWLLANRNFDVFIEGHCDERGTAEYNLALGERRAKAAMDYLVNLGVESNRLSMVSYGEERPIDPRSNEEAWAKNRRGQFNIFPRTW